MTKTKPSPLPTTTTTTTTLPTRPRPILFLDIDGVLNTTKHNTQLHFEPHLLQRLRQILQDTDAILVLTTFWRHFHEYIGYVFHRHGIDAARHTLPLPMGVTGGKQCTKNFLFHCRIRQQQQQQQREMEEEENGGDGDGSMVINDESESNNTATTTANGSMIGRSAEDEGEYSSRAEEIEAWLRVYGERYLGRKTTTTCPPRNRSDEDGNDDDPGTATATATDTDTDQTDNPNNEEERYYHFHSKDWKYVILDDRPSAATPDTPLFDRFVLTETAKGLTEEDAERAVRLLRFGPPDEK